MCIFIVYICIIGPLLFFDYTNFKASLVIKIINFNIIKNVAHLAMLAIFYGNVKCKFLSKNSIHHAIFFHSFSYVVQKDLCVSHNLIVDVNYKF